MSATLPRALRRLAALLLAASALAAPAGGALAQGAAPVPAQTPSQTISPPPALADDEIERRVEALLGRMTLEEKVGQLNLAQNERWFDDGAVEAGRVGAVINFNAAPDIARAQAAARRSRLGIPLLFGLDILHGHRTIYPVPLAEAASFNPDLARQAAEMSAREASYMGIQWTYAPMADLSRDPRWGRIVEGNGEDPYLNRVFTAARVEGFRAGGLAVSLKHFAGYGAANGGRDYDSTDIALGDFRDSYLEPFRGGIAAGAETVMSAFNALNGVPATANRWLLTDVLRGELGFRGFVVSDWASIEELVPHGIAADEAEAARKALVAGVDMDLASGLYDRHIAAEVRAGRLDPAVVDQAVRRVLRVKFALGLFDRASPDTARVDSSFPTPESRALARESARQSMVLLRNQGGVLPLRAGTRRIAVVGPLADAPFDQNGPHAARGGGEDTVSFLAGIRARAAAAGAAVEHVPGCDLVCTRDDGFAAAARAAEAADVTLAIVGEPVGISGEAASRAHLSLPDRQAELVAALARTGKPVVLVVVGGRPMTLGALADEVPGILMAWYPGNEGGPALAELVFGDAAPSAKLPVTWPRAVGQVPLTYNRLPTGRPPQPGNRFRIGYVDEALTPLYPFGHGLTYTAFTYGAAAVRTPRVGAGDHVEVEVAVGNSGARAGTEVVQLYTRQPVASRSRPLRELKAFARVALEPGETRLVTLRVPVRALGFHLEDGTYVVEPGRFEAFIGGSSEAGPAGAFEVIEGVREPPGRQRSAGAEGERGG